jgi:hypothetical protein
MGIALGEFVVGAMRLSLFQDRVTGKIYHCGLRGNREYVIPSQNNIVQVFGRSGQSISPPLPREALEAFKTNKNRPRK